MELKVDNLCKVYGNNQALRNVSFTLTPGIYGLLGPNGSGKSTLMSILTGNLQASSGAVYWDEKNIASLGREYRALLGYVPQQQSLYLEFTASRFLFYMSALKGIKPRKATEQVASVLSAVELDDVANKKIKTFSGGMKQRLLLAQSLLGDPRLLVMDEPTVGLDPYQRDSLRNLIVKASAKRIVLLSTHVVSDIEWIADEIILLRKGELIRMGDRSSLVSEIENYTEHVTKCERFARTTGKSLEKPLSLEDVYLYFYGESDVSDRSV